MSMRMQHAFIQTALGVVLLKNIKYFPFTLIYTKMYNVLLSTKEI